jgi:hypothetical protein
MPGQNDANKMQFCSQQELSEKERARKGLQVPWKSGSVYHKPANGN